MPATGVRPQGRGLCVHGASDWSKQGSGCWPLGWDRGLKDRGREGLEQLKPSASPWCETMGHRDLAHVSVEPAAGASAGECVNTSEEAAERACGWVRWPVSWV